MAIDIEIDEKLYNKIDSILENSIDKEILKDLGGLLNTVREKSRALAASLNRCFTNTKKSYRFVEVYKLGVSDRNAKKDLGFNDEKLTKYLEDQIKEYFEKNDFMHYREFVRLLRACTIDVGGNVSGEIKIIYNNYFSGKRLIEAYRLGFDLRSQVLRN